MSNGTLAARYAQALFDAAEEQQITADIAEQIDMIFMQMEENEAFKDLMSGRGVSAPRKKEMLEKVYDGALHPYVRNFLFLLLDKNREGIIEDSLEAFRGLYRKKLGVVTATLTTAKPIDKEDEEKLTASLKKILNSDVVIKKEIDPSLIGGAVINVGDLLIDGSLKSELRHMREELMK